MTAWTTYIDALRTLHADAGAPSTRAMAQRATTHAGRSVSHTTANALIHGKRLGGWELTRAIVLGLDGDEARFHDLWTNAWLELNSEAPEPPERSADSTVTVELRAIRLLLEQINDSLRSRPTS